MTTSMQVPSLKAHLKTTAVHSRNLKHEEQKALRSARILHGIPVNRDGSRISKRHQKGKDKPEIPEPMKIKLEGKDREREEEISRLRYWNLHHQRVHELRRHARNVHLIYGFLRGRSYEEMEQGAYSSPGGPKDDWEELEKILTSVIKDEKLQPQVVQQRYAEWLSEARDYYKTKGNLNPRKKTT